jgi:S-adenosylmethionine:tRNA ribosyltransferase-isomerase
VPVFFTIGLMDLALACAPIPVPPLRLQDFQFNLPSDLIAQVPAERRDHARLLVLEHRSGRITHAQVHELPGFLRPGDLLVLNDTRVVPARVPCRAASGGAVELLLIRQAAAGRWLCLGKPARRLRAGTVLRLPDGRAARVAAARPGGEYDIDFERPEDVTALLAQYGELPLPPYIRRAHGPLPLDQTRYQTVFATHPGAVAAPTAGLHFTDDLLRAVRECGVELAALTLHVGPATFRPLRVEDPREHRMDPEWCVVPPGTAAAVARARRRGGRVVAVGTTTTRALESAACSDGTLEAGPRWAERFIVPGHKFRIVDALFTNFHLPGSTLLLLVSAFAGRDRTLAAYDTAIRHRYRFYSYGDAMLIV